MPLGLGFQIKSPKIFAASQPTAEGWRGIGGKASIGMGVGSKKDLAEGPRSH